MSTFLKTALTATLALSAFTILAGSKHVRAEASPLTDSNFVLYISSPVGSTPTAPIHRSIRHFADPLQASFDPEPNDPPARTGGSGTR